MSKLGVTLDILNQKGTPAFYSDIFTNRPAAGFAGRVFISTDTGEIYEDTGSTWTLIADAGAGTTGTLQQVTTNGNSTTLPIIVQNMLLSVGAGTGTRNTGLGINALVFNTTGQSNTAIGNSVLLNNSTGNGNVGVGSRALTANTTGGNNVAIGNDSLYINTTGNSNTGIGTAALSLNTSGGGNTAVGNSALNINTTANYNTAVGNSSLSANTTGTNNTAVGSFSLYANTTGGTNTAIGYNAGSSITTGSNNTILGSYAGTAALASHIVLSDGAANVRLYSNATGLIGINQAVGTPSAQLDIHTTQTYGLAVNGTTTNNAYLGFANAGTYKWRIGNNYNAGANTLDFYNVGTSTTALSFNATTNAATFSSSVTAGTRVIVSGSMILGEIISSYSTIETTTGNGIWLRPAGGSDPIGLKIATTGTAIFNGGNVLIGSTTDDTINKLQVTGNLTANIINANSTGSTQIFLKSSGTGANRQWQIQSNETVAGDISIMQSTTAGGSTYATKFNISDTGVVKIINLAGTGSRAVIADASGNLSAPVSDISVKQNIQTIGYGLNEILKMNPVWFDYIDEYKNYGQSRQNGNIAQEMETIIPEAVFTTPSTGKMGINYDQLHAVYIKAIQELKAEIDALKKN